MEKTLVQEHVNHWISKYPELAKFFNHKIIKPLLLGCEIVTMNHHRKNKLVYDFVSGLAMIYPSLKNNDDENVQLGKEISGLSMINRLNESNEKLLLEGEKRTKPIFDLFLKYARSDTFQTRIIDSYIFGEDSIKVGKVHIPITEKTLFKFLKKQQGFVFGREDVKKLYQDFEIDRIDFYKPEETNNFDQKKPKVKWIALKHFYEGIHITEMNAENIIREYGWTSGENLLLEYQKFLDKSERIGRPSKYSKLIMKNRIKLFESVYETLPDNKKALAKDEINILKEIYKADFEQKF